VGKVSPFVINLVVEGEKIAKFAEPFAKKI
jgi:hypothetical protein